MSELIKENSDTIRESVSFFTKTASPPLFIRTVEEVSVIVIVPVNLVF